MPSVSASSAFSAPRSSDDSSSNGSAPTSPTVEGRLADVRSALPDLADVRSALPDLADVRSALPDLADVRSALPDLADVRSAVADLADLRSTVATSLQRLDEVVEEATQLIESTLEPLEHQMPAVGPGTDPSGAAAGPRGRRPTPGLGRAVGGLSLGRGSPEHRYFDMPQFWGISKEI